MAYSFKPTPDTPGYDPQLDDFNYNPEEAQAQALDSEIAKYNNWNLEEVRNPGQYIRFARDLGLSTDRYKSEADRLNAANWDINKFYNMGPDSDGSFDRNLASSLHRSDDQEGGRQEFSRMLQEKRNQLQQQKANLLDQGKERRIQRGQRQEKRLGDTLEGFRSEIDSAIDRYMGTQLEEIGFRADVARQGVSGDFANRGLLRSSMANQRLGDVTVGELGEKAEVRGQGENQKFAIDTGVQDVKDQITKQRERLKINNQLSEVAAAENILYQFDETDLRNSINLKLQQMDLDADSQNFFIKLLGGALSNVGKIVAKL